MSKEKNNNDDFKEFLGKINTSGNLPAGDFEKEALEGFAMLENEQEAIDLKKSLDNKISEKLFDTEKKSTARTYWLAAAAGLILIIGFTVYFISGNTSVAKNEDLAISMPESPDEFRAAPKEPEAEVQQAPLKEEKADLPAAKTIVQQAEEKPVKHIAPPPVMPAEKAASKKRNSSLTQSDDLANANAGLATSEAETNSQESAVVNKNKENVPDKSVEMAPAIVSSNGAMMDNIPDNAAYRSNAPSAASPAYKFNAPAAVKIFNSDSIYTCTYTGGETALHKDLSVKLGAKNIAQKFEAVLSVNEKWVVTKVKITKPYTLNSAQQLQLIELLKSLDKFTCTGIFKGLMEYKVVYKP